MWAGLYRPNTVPKRVNYKPYLLLYISIIMKKRKNTWFNPNASRGKRQRCINDARRANQGFLFTCAQHRQREAMREAYNLLHEAAELLGEATELEVAQAKVQLLGEAQQSGSGDASAPSAPCAPSAPSAPSAPCAPSVFSGSRASSEAPQSSASLSAGSLLAAEIASLKDGASDGDGGDGGGGGDPAKKVKQPRRRFNALPSNIKGCFTITMDRAGTTRGPIDYAKTICSLGRTQLHTRYLTRIIPLQHICRSRDKDLRGAVVPLLDAFLIAQDKASMPWTFGVEYKGRHVEKGFRGKAIDVLASAVADRHAVAASAGAGAGAGADAPQKTLSVHLKRPDLVVLCQAFSPLCGITVLSGDDYRACEKFNVAKLSGVVTDAAGQITSDPRGSTSSSSAGKLDPAGEDVAGGAAGC